MANSAKLYKSMLDGLEYRGTAFFQCYTTCQPEHGVPDNMSADQAKMIRDARGMPEFVFNPRKGESIQEAFDLKGNPSLEKDWWQTKFSTGEDYNFTVAHWALTEGRFRKHLKAITEDEARELILLDDMLVFITQDDVVYRRVFDKNHRSYVPNFGVYFKADRGAGRGDIVFRRDQRVARQHQRPILRRLQCRNCHGRQPYARRRAGESAVAGL
jgi:pyruvate-ferredoxin/flavodoxin oxidoreductase